MNNILFGNGININFTGTHFLSSTIIIRAIANIRNKKNYKEAYTEDILNWLKLLYEEFENTRNGNNDLYVVASFDKRALDEFKERYKNVVKPKIYDIGFEDYFLLHDIFCHKNNIENPNMFNFRELLKRMFLDSIYFKGKILNISKKYPSWFIDYMDSFDKLFTTNYDNNIETRINRPVHYLHGAFHIIDDVYDPNSFRNQLSDTKNETYDYVKKTPYLFSTALSTYTGDLKESKMKQNKQANACIEKMALGYQNNTQIKKDVDKWKNESNPILRNFHESIMLKLENNDYTFNERYSIDEFEDLDGELTIIGLSPFNDSHLFQIINNNEKLKHIKYYYFDTVETETIKHLLNKKNLDFEDVKEFWSNKQI